MHAEFQTIDIMHNNFTVFFSFFQTGHPPFLNLSRTFHTYYTFCNRVIGSYKFSSEICELISFTS